MDITTLLTPHALVSLLTLTLMEIVLGIDNLIFISIVSGKLPKAEQPKARFIGLFLALGFRIALLCMISWIIGLVHPIFTLLEHGVSGRDLVLLTGGLFLISKSTLEIHEKIEGEHSDQEAKRKSFWGTVGQIVLLDIVFSFDSVITAVGLVKELPIMILAVILSMFVMLAAAANISEFINKHPTIKMLALAFLLMIGTMLFAEGLHFEMPKGYVYFAMAFSCFVEFLNMKVRSNAKH